MKIYISEHKDIPKELQEWLNNEQKKGEENHSDHTALDYYDTETNTAYLKTIRCYCGIISNQNTGDTK